ncbi:hypothetical protein [Colwellia sp. 12G3]|uniref:hypothetical protein n=1 Tax=Colwellia sp. 12G3 TaxID=2058299 RepID=UPI0012FF1740|nr:hypothetical protein [Colwellia sp. 12G3]
MKKEHNNYSILDTFKDHENALKKYISKFFLPSHEIEDSGVFRINEAPFKYIIDQAKLSYRQQQIPPLLTNYQKTLFMLLTDQAQPMPMDEIFAENLLPNDSIDMLLASVKQTVTKAGNIIKVSKITPRNQLTGRFIIEGELSNVEVFFMLTPEKNPLIHKLKI